jgi:NAD(P)H-dependent FMN reductase
MIKLIGISGSLRAASFNTTLLRAAAQLADPGVQIEVVTLQGIPLYDGDLEAASGLPPAVQLLKERIQNCDGVLLATPEYNSGMPGVVKNAFDWMSRPVTDIAKVFGAKPLALLGASPSGFGTLLAQSAWLPVLKHLGVNVWSGGRVMVSRAHTLIDANGQISDEATRKQLGEFVQGFAAFALAAKGQR